jgi:uncharacterized protein (DUF934 family)
MLLTENGRLHEDGWHHLEDEEPVPESNAVTVSLARWEKADPDLRARNGKLGLRLPNSAPVEPIARYLNRFDLIVLHFPKFTDGRAYSQARLLRSRYGYKRELRATGDVLRDQLLFMRRCGFDSFVVGERAIKENWAKAFAEFDVFYQGAPDERPWVMRQRLSPRH